MPPRECDNDNCDYETYVDDCGHGRARWIHVPECGGRVEFNPPDPDSVPEGSFAAYLMGRGQ